MSTTEKTIIVHGPAGCGKTRNAKAIARHFGCRRIVDGWGEDDASARLTSGALHLTTMKPNKTLAGRARIVSFADLPSHLRGQAA